MRRLACLLLAACGAAPRATPPPATPTLDVPGTWADPEDDRPRGDVAARPGLRDATVNPAAPKLALRGATVLTAVGPPIEDGTVLLAGGAIVAVGGPELVVPSDATVVDLRGRFVTPGIIDAHSHLGVYAAPSAEAHSDGNEMTGPVTAHVRAEDAYWPQDPQIARALAAGVTTALILPGSANLVGGQGFTVALRPGVTSADVAFPGAPMTVKMACGENPKRTHGTKGGPQTRMAVYAGFRALFEEAAVYVGKRRAYARARARWVAQRARAAELDAAGGKPIEPVAAPEPLAPDARLDAIAALLEGEALAQIHCYRADEMAQLLAIADEVGLSIRSFHHALEAYKLRADLARRGVAVNTWADWWGFKLEAHDGIPENAGLLTAAGARVTIHSDSAQGIQRLNQEAAKAMTSARAAGLAVDELAALRWITANPAWVLGIDAVTGTLEAGKRADVVVWDRHPFSVYAHAELVLQAGEVVHRRADGRRPTDHELGEAP